MALPTSTNDVTARKLGAVINSLWSKIKSTFVKKAGDTMTGRLTLEKPLSQVIIGTGTAGSSSSGTYYPAKWNFDLGIATPTAGDQLVIKMPTAGHDYGVYMSTDNGTTYFPVARHTGASRLTTQYPNGAYIHLVYETYVTNSSASGQVDSIFPVAGGTDRVSQKIGCWRVINDYDSGNDYGCVRTENGRFYTGSTGCNPYTLVCLDSAGKYSMLISAGSGTGTSKTINTAGKFKLGAVILYHSANRTVAANTLINDTYNTYVVHPNIDTRYSHNYTTTFTANSPLYIECTIDANGYWSPTEKCITQTFVAGKYYIYLGLTYSTAYQLSLSTDHPVYYYDGTNLVDYMYGMEPMYDARYARYDTAGDGWVRLAHTEEKSRTNSDVIAEWDVAYSTAGGGVYHEKLFLGVRFNSSGKGVLNQFWRRYVNNNTGVVKFAVKVTGVGGSGNTSVELWAFLTKNWNGLAIKQVAGNGYALSRYRTAWFYESYDSVGGTTKPVEDTANNIYVYDPTNQTVAIGSFLPLAGGTMTGKINAWASQYTDDGTTGAIDMKNSNIVGLNSLYTADASDGASEGIHFFRESGKYDTLWMAGGHMYFVPNRAVGTSTSAADSKKVAILPASITSGHIVVTDGMSGDVKGVAASTLTVGAATKATQDSDGNAINATYFKSSGNVTLVSGTATKIGTQNGTDVKLTLPTIPAAANNGALQLQLNGGTATSKFTANQSGNSTLAFSTGSTAGTFKVDTTEIAIAGFTKVESSSTNGNIKINGTETTVYTHPTTAGNKHIPSGGSSGQFLGYDSAGTAKWVNNPNTDTKQNITLATTTKVFITGVSTTPTSTAQALTGLADTGVYLTTTAGELNATQYKVNEHCTMKYNSTKSSLDFTFS